MQKRIAFRYALIAFVIAVVWTMVEHYLGYNTTNHQVGQYARMLSAFVFYFCIILAVWEVRRKQNNELSFTDGLRTGAILSGIYSFFIAGWYAIYGEIINPQYQSTLIEFERKKMIAANLSQKQMADKLQQVEMSSGGSISSYILLIVFMFLFGMVVAFITTLVLKRKRKAI
jgi:cytochrome bd-type quinol oxidase subunit 2